MSGPHEYSMCGVKVKFPAKAYPSQVAMMSKIVTSLQRSQNSLLESPTGSGKSLALLCAALAWQEAEQRKCNEFNQMLEVATTNQDPAMRDVLVAMAGNEGVEWEDDMEPPIQNNHEDAALVLAKAESLATGAGGGFMPADPDDDDFSDAGAKKTATAGYHLPPGGDIKQVGAGAGYLRMPKRRKCPRIYFGTRTHKQVAQIVRELKKTAYAGVRMTILASREHTCIHPTVSKSFNKNQDCQDLMDRRKGGGCRFQANVKQKMASHHSVRAYIGTEVAWDLEELVKAGRKVKACPYYATRELKNSAQIIFCPYNYLVEPRIRKSMEIFLKNQIVILDEAHNIEDSAREAASGKFKLDDVTAALQDCERMVEHDILPGVHGGLAAFLSRLGTWMQKSAEDAKDYSDFNSSTKVWTGTTGMAEWNEILFYPETYGDIKIKLQEALKEQAAAFEQNNDDGFEEGHTKVLSKMTSDLLDGIFSVLDFMHRKDSLYRDDYRMSVVKAQERKKGGKARGWTGKGDTSLVSTVTLNFWCLNPGVCFDEMLDCKSIVLTSGTLSPMVTFASELEVKFPITLEANHVIDKSQVWVGTLGAGPTNHSLNASYQNANTYGFQDEVGRLVVEICKTVPHGILVFFPSYKMLNDLSERWKNNGTWQQLFERKAIITEPRGGDQLDSAMKEFYSVIEASNTSPTEIGQDGAIFMAVCRGKVSEGLDFADNNARAVVCVGIPFPAFKDTLVDLKKKYNDGRRSRNPNILPGRDWYEIQAFRALNQALGRCIRHKRDWGAILMVDDRYRMNPRYVNSLSKWVRGKVVHHSNCNTMLNSLKTFSADMKLFDAENGSEVDAFTAPTSDNPKPDTASYFPPAAGHPTSACSPKTDSSASLASKVSSLVNLRKSDPKLTTDKKSDPKLTTDFKGWGKRGKTEKRVNQPDVPNLSTGDNLDTETHLASDLDTKSHLSGLSSSSSNPTSSESEIPLDGDKIRLGPPKSRGRQKKLKEQKKVNQNQSKPDITIPEGPQEESIFLPNMNFNDPVNSPAFEVSFDSLYNNSTINCTTSNSSLKVISHTNIKVVESKSQKSRKMSFVSSDEEDEVKSKIVTTVPDSVSKTVSSSKPSPLLISSSKPAPTSVNSSKPASSSFNSSQTASTPISSSKLAPSTSNSFNPASTSINFSKHAISSSKSSSTPIIPTESVKRKNCSVSSPECNFDLTSEFDSVPVSGPDKTSIADKSTDPRPSTDPRSSYKQKLQQFVYKPDNEKPESSENVESILDTTDPLPSGSPILASKRSRLSTGKRARLCSGQILRYSSPTAEVEKENSEDRALVQLMLKRRRESGQVENVDPELVLETPGSAGIFLDTPDEMDNFDLGSDFEDESEFAASKTSAALVDVSNQPVGTRKPLFKPEVSQPAPPASPTIIYSSGDDVWPEDKKQIQPSLSSADEIDEPEDILRRVKQPEKKKLTKKKKKSVGGKRSLSLTLGTSLQGGNSDDDFM